MFRVTDGWNDALSRWWRIVHRGGSVVAGPCRHVSVVGASASRVHLLTVSHVGNKRRQYGRFDTQWRHGHRRFVTMVLLVFLLSFKVDKLTLSQKRFFILICYSFFTFLCWVYLKMFKVHQLEVFCRLLELDFCLIHFVPWLEQKVDCNL